LQQNYTAAYTLITLIVSFVISVLWHPTFDTDVRKSCDVNYVDWNAPSWLLHWIKDQSNKSHNFKCFLFRPFYVSSGAFFIPTKCTMSVIYIHLMHICYMFQCLCAIIRKRNYTSTLKTSYFYDIVAYALNSVAYM